MPDLFQRQSYHYDLPKHLIAQYPLAERQQSRLMVLDRKDNSIKHMHFYDISNMFVPGDVIVLNKTKVIPARLFAKKENGTEIEVFLLHQTKADTWKCLVHPGKRIKSPQMLFISDDFTGFISESDSEGLREIKFNFIGDFWSLLDKYGHVPLPPYIDRSDESHDVENYQTVYAQERGSVAAPTAGLHFSNEVIDTLKSRGVLFAEVVLHVGLGTFRPVKVDNITEHVMHSELCMISPETASLINQAKSNGNKVIAVGTTSVRTLESFSDNGFLTHGEKWTNIFIYPGKKLSIVDNLITNFHLPESTLLMLVSAIAGYELCMKAYDTAIQEEYRFFSYGDAMLIL